MSDIKLFQQSKEGYIALLAKGVRLEKHLQTLIENNMETFLGMRFLITEYSTDKAHKGRVDSLGLDENYCPVIVEYKRHQNQNIITQGLFYLDWLFESVFET